MKRLIVVALFFLMSACTTNYVIVDEEVEASMSNEVYADNGEQFYVDEAQFVENVDRRVSADDVFVVGESDTSVTYQYKNVRVDEVSPLASMYCADVAHGRSPFLRDVILFNNGFMRATFDCVNVAI